jgi:hypothetical protein
MPIPASSSVAVQKMSGTKRSLVIQNTGGSDIRISNDQDALDASVDLVTGTVTDGWYLAPYDSLVILDAWEGELYARACGIPSELEVRWSGMEPNKPGSRGANFPIPPPPPVKAKLKNKFGW